MAYNVVWADKALDDIAALDKKTVRSIMDKVENHLAKDPLNLSKSLIGIFKGLYRYRFGKYRVIFFLDNKDNLLSVVRVGHRKDVYGKK